MKRNTQALSGKTVYSQDIVDTTWGPIFTACYPVTAEDGSNDVIDNGIQVALDVKRLLPLSEDGDKNGKMSEFERIECIERVRNDLRSMNYKIRKMCRLMRYTTLMDSWYELKGTYRKPKSMIEICNRSQKRWTSTAKAAAKLNCEVEQRRSCFQKVVF